MFLLFTVDPVYGQPDEPMEQPANQRLIRLQNKNGVADTIYRVNLIGGKLSHIQLKVLTRNSRWCS